MFVCPHCQRQFGDENALSSHAKAKHRIRRPRPEPDDEPSLAEIAIEASWKHAAGLPLDPLEESMLDDTLLP